MVSTMEGAAFILTGTDPYSGYRVSFPVQNTTSKATMCGLTENPICSHVIPQRLNLTSCNTNVLQRVYADGMHQFYCISHQVDS